MSVLKRHAVDLLGGLVLLVFVAATVLSGYELWVQRTLLGKVDRGATFSAVQLEREYVKLGAAVARYWAEPTAAHQERLRLRFDIFWSRFPILLDGPEGEAVRRFPGNLDRLTWGQETLPELEAAILALDPADPASLAPVRDLLDAYHEPVTAIARNALQIDNYESTLEQLLKAHLKSLYLYIIVMVAGVLLLLLLRRQVWRARAFAAQAGEAELALRRRVAAIEASDDGIALLDPECRFTYVNAAYARIYGHADPVALVGRSWTENYEPDEAERMNAEVYAALSTHGRYRGEAEGRRTDGSVFPMELSINQLDDSNTVAVVRDLTELKAAEAERAILREQRFRSQKLEAIGRLAGGIAHDFNNILAAIIGYADFLMEDLPRGSESRTFAGNIHTAGHRAKRLVTQILTFSRQHDCRPVRTDLGDVLEETATMLRATLPSTALLDLDLPEEPVFAQVDAGQIGQVVMNLCVNARDALGERQGQIAVRLEPVTAADAGAAEGPPNLTGSWNAVQVDPIRELGAVRIEATDRGGAVLRVGQVAPGTPVARITVTDTGCGIERATLERLFDPFFTTKPVGQGTGLGLATVYGIVAAHGGALEVESRPGDGACFTVVLPALAVGDRAEVAAEAPEDQDLARLPAAKPPRVLVVDDEPMVRALIARQLSQHGFVAETAPDGAAALARLADPGDATVDLLVTDYAMPVMTGLELAERLAAEPLAAEAPAKAPAKGGRRLPVILCSGNPDAIGADAPCLDAVLQKPVEPGVLVRTARQLLDRAAPLRRSA